MAVDSIHATSISGSSSKMTLFRVGLIFGTFSRILEALLFSTSLSPHSLDAHQWLGEWSWTFTHGIIWRLDDATCAEIWRGDRDISTQ